MIAGRLALSGNVEARSKYADRREALVYVKDRANWIEGICRLNRLGMPSAING